MIQTSSNLATLRGIKRSIRHVYAYLEQRNLATVVAIESESTAIDVTDTTPTISSVCRNEVGVQLLSRRLHEQVFQGADFPPPTKNHIQLAQKHLEKHGLWGKLREEIPNTSFDLPTLQGKNIDEHFWNIGIKLAEPTLSMAKAFSSTKLPFSKPKTWLKKSGWTKYTKDGKIISVPFPEEDLLCFDVETLYKISPFSVMACAASPIAWYGWVSPWLLGETNVMENLIPLGDPTKNRIIVGHNVAYDRARIFEEYNLKGTKNAYLDTMSLHVAVSGMCSRQRPVWIKYQKEKAESDDQDPEDDKLWQEMSAINSLKDVAKFHCKINMNKEIRNAFGECTREEILQDFQNLMTYCANDVEITHKVFRKIFPGYLKVCPHPVSFFGMIQMGSTFLTVDESWKEYLKRSEETYQELSKAVQKRLHELAEEALNMVNKPEKYLKDPWLSQLNWKIKEPGNRIKKLPGYPEWYREICDKTNSMNLTVRARIAPILLKLSWLGFPLYHARGLGWMFRVPKDKVESLGITSTPCKFEIEGNLHYNEDKNGVYFKVPHKDGEKANVGNPLSKNYVSAFEQGVLTSAYPDAKKALEMNMQCSYWISARDRIMNQFVVWKNPENHIDLGINQTMNGTKPGIILPQLVPMGTITRRAVENTWLTASNAKKNRVGSELKSMIKAPLGYKIVGADVDSEELWIASLLGDAQFGIHGGTALGWMTLEGTKSMGTDLHSKTANILGISRNNAKIFNYGRIYGAGLKYAIQLLMKFNPALSLDQATAKASELYIATKGNKLRDPVHFGRIFWHGGTESFMFNCLEEIADMDFPRTPTLGCGITDALKKQYIQGDYMPSRINWAVQSSGVDYLHLLLVSMSYLIEKYDISARYMLSVHDEVRFLVKDEDKYRAALALQVANLWTRALFSFNVKMADLPQSVAFFSAVDIDHVLRKEVDLDCLTPSNPNPIPSGEALTIEQILERIGNGSLKKETSTLNSMICIDQGGGQSILENSISPSYLSLAHFDRKQDLWFMEAQSLIDVKKVKELSRKRDKVNNVKRKKVPTRHFRFPLSNRSEIKIHKNDATRKRITSVLNEIHADIPLVDINIEKKTSRNIQKLPIDFEKKKWNKKIFPSKLKLSGNTKVNTPSFVKSVPNVLSSTANTEVKAASLVKSVPNVLLSTANTEVKAPVVVKSLPKVLSSTANTEVKAPVVVKSLPKVLSSTANTEVKAPVVVKSLPKVLASTANTEVKAPVAVKSLPKVLSSTANTEVKAPVVVKSLPKVLSSTANTEVKAPVVVKSLPKVLSSTANTEVKAPVVVKSLPKVLSSTANTEVKTPVVVKSLPKVLASSIKTKVKTPVLVKSLPKVKIPVLLKSLPKVKIPVLVKSPPKVKIPMLVKSLPKVKTSSLVKSPTKVSSLSASTNVKTPPVLIKSKSSSSPLQIQKTPKQATFIMRRNRGKTSLAEHYIIIPTPKDRKLAYVQCVHCSKSMADSGPKKLIKHLVETCEKVPKSAKKMLELHAKVGPIHDIGLLINQLRLNSQVIKIPKVDNKQLRIIQNYKSTK